MLLRYFVPFKAQEGISADFALKEKLLNIEGLAVDTSVNANKWQVPEEDLDFFVSTLINAQLRIDHAESAMAVIGKVPESKRIENTAWFRAEIGDLPIIEKVLRGYLKYVSVQVDSDDVECSKCKRPSRKEGMLIHLCPGGWEIVHKPKVRELSIVASPAYEKTQFRPVGFAAAMDESQGIDFPCGSCSKSCSNDADVGSKGNLQEPENKILDAKEVKLLSQNAEKDASPLQAQGVVNVAPGEGAPKQHTYEEYMQQLQQLEKEITKMGASEAELESLKKKVAELEGEVAKRATKKTLSKKISDLTKQLQQPEEKTEESEEAAAATAEGARASGKGIVAVDEIKHDALGNYDWFRDLLKAHKKLTGFQ